MSETIETVVNGILNQWSLAIQMSILCVFVIIFFALKRNSPRKMIKSWFIAWAFDAFALLMVFLVLKSGQFHFPAIWARIFYSFYAVTKIWFAIMIFIGLFQFLHERDFIKKQTFIYLLITSLVIVLLLVVTPIESFSIQTCVYFLVGFIFSIGAIILAKKFWHSQAKILLIVILCEGILFLHHGIILLLVYFGSPLPAYMTHISFFDAIFEMIVGITCLFAIANKVNTEMLKRNKKLTSSQQTLRKLVNVDSLTGLWHKRYFKEFLNQHKAGATIVYIKINKLDAINDEWGYAVGDLCLTGVADLMQKQFSANDGLFRLGGNTFLVIVPQTDKNLVTRKVQKLKNKLLLNPVIAPIVTLSTSTTSYQQKSLLEKALEKSLY